MAGNRWVYKQSPVSSPSGRVFTVFETLSLQCYIGRRLRDLSVVIAEQLIVKGCTQGFVTAGIGLSVICVGNALNGDTELKEL